jgi:hypothetical protein
LKKKLSRIATVGAAVLGALAFSAAPASAGVVKADMGAAYGVGDFRYAHKTYADFIHLELTDLKADGHHVRIRVQSLTPDRETTSYSWRSVTTGYGSQGVWETELRDSRGIWAMRIQVCVFEGNTALGCEESRWDGNTHY